jgi:hypothetical protein
MILLILLSPSYSPKTYFYNPTALLILFRFLIPILLFQLRRLRIFLSSSIFLLPIFSFTMNVCILRFLLAVSEQNPYVQLLVSLLGNIKLRGTNKKNPPT